MIDLTTIDLTPVVELAIMLMSALITAFVIPWIKAKANDQQWEALVKVTRTAVFAAEQIYGSKWGKEKRAYAQEYIRKKGYTVDVDLIEATVRQHFGHWDNPITDDKATEEESEEEDEQSESNESDCLKSPSVASAEPGSVMAEKEDEPQTPLM